MTFVCVYAMMNLEVVTLKCSHCGFTYDDEAICPICGTPAPRVEPIGMEPIEEEPIPYYTPAHAAAPAAAPSRPKAARHAAPQPARLSRPKGLRIATFCVLAVIAAALVFNTVMQSAAVIREQKRDKQISELLGLSDPSSAAGKENSGDMLNEMFEDVVTHKIGEGFDFTKGTVSLKSVTVTKTKSTFDAKQRQVAFTIEVVNSTKETQHYAPPKIRVGNDDYDKAHYLFSEASVRTDKQSCEVAPGKKLLSVCYYNLPNDNRSVSATVILFGDDMQYSVYSTYTLALNAIK